MHFPKLCVLLASAALLSASTAIAAGYQADKNKTVAEATGGRFKTTKGKYFDEGCNENLDYDAEVIDLNGDGQPEVFLNIRGTCLGGATGVRMDLYIKNSKGQWKPQFGFQGIYNVLKTRFKGYPDIEIGGPGFCFPIWRWNGTRYALFKKCRP